MNKELLMEYLDALEIDPMLTKERFMQMVIDESEREDQERTDRQDDVE